MYLFIVIGLVATVLVGRFLLSWAEI